MNTAIPALGPISCSHRLMFLTAAFALLLAFAFAQPGLAQTTEPLKFSNNFFVTGDYVVGGWVKATSDGSFSTGTITIPDPQAYVSNAPLQQVPVGADVVAAFLYWSAVETVGSNAGSPGFFRGAPITGEGLGNPNAPVSWSSGGCVGSAGGSKTMQVYRANVSAYLPVDSNGNVQPNSTYPVRLTDGKNATVLGATLVIVYRVLSPDVPLKAVVIYDGAYAPSNAALIVRQKLQGFYQPGDQGTSVAKFTAIVANGQSNKNEQVYLNSYDSTGQVLLHSTPLTSLYGTKPPFPGMYNGSWDNPTWFPNAYAPTNTAVQSTDSSETVVVQPSSSNKGCVSWGAAVLSTTVQNSDRDGLLDIWKTNQGYCDARSNLGLTSQGTCHVGDVTDPYWVDLTGASPNQKDVFVQLDYMCSANADGTANCDPGSGGFSYFPGQTVLDNVTGAFSANGHGVNVHIDINPNNQPIPAATCTDNLLASPPQYCPFPGQAGVVGWKAGFASLKSQPLNYPDETSCVTRTPPGGTAGSGPICIRRFQPGRNNSYHEVIFGRASAAPNWTLADGSLVSVGVLGSLVTFTTSSAHGLAKATSSSDTTANARVTINDAVSNPNLNGTFLVQSVLSPTSFTINANATTAPTRGSDPFLSVTSGVVGTGSGVSDVGGADSLISLGLWGADGQAVPAASGTFMHEVGHSIGLTHGGLYSDPVSGGYAFTFEANCKSNFQSVMNYMFQVDLLDGHLDYSEQDQNTLDESHVSPPGVLSGSLTTKWYSPTRPLVGSAATSHCDGTPLLPTDSPMYRLEGPASTITWAANQDINFDGIIEPSLDGYNDWSHIDPRQVGIDLRQAGATGNDFWSGGSSRVGGGSSRVGGGSSRVGGGSSRVGGGSSRVGGGSSRVGGGVGEIDFRAANSVVRAPSGLTATLGSQNSALLNWTAPSFAQGLIAGFNVYRSKNGGPFAQLPPTPTKPVPAGTPLPLSSTFTTFTDTTVSCVSGNYTYFVTTVITDTAATGTTGTTRESLASNLAPCSR
jgi:hypothetical protein